MSNGLIKEGIIKEGIIKEGIIKEGIIKDRVLDVAHGLLLMAEITIRPATLGDALAIGVVHVKTWQFAYRGLIPDDFLDGLSVDARTTRWQNILTAQDAQVQTFVADVRSEIVGFCSVGKCRDEDAKETYGELYALYVDPHSMKQGVGSALAEAGQDFLIAQGFIGATLWVLAANARARRFYASQGWVADGVTRTEEIGNAQIPEVRYTIRFLSKQQFQS